MSSEYQPVVPTALRSLYGFGQGPEGTIAVRHSYPQATLRKALPNVERAGCAAQSAAAQVAFVVLARAQSARDLDGPEEGLLPECLDAPFEGNALHELREPTSLDGAALASHLRSAGLALDDLADLLPAACDLARAWLGAGRVDGQPDPEALRAALEPIAGSQSEGAHVPPGSVGFARFCRRVPAFAGAVPTRSHKRMPRTLFEIIDYRVTGELPDDETAPTGGAGDWEFPVPSAPNQNDPLP